MSITQEQFDHLLEEILGRLHRAALLSVPGIYECVSEHFNDAVLEQHAEQDPCNGITLGKHYELLGDVWVEVRCDDAVDTYDSDGAAAERVAELGGGPVAAFVEETDTLHLAGVPEDVGSYVWVVPLRTAREAGFSV